MTTFPTESRREIAGFFVAGYNAFMQKWLFISLAVFIIAGSILFSALPVPRGDESRISIKTIHGLLGELVLSIPGQVFVGDRAEVSTRIKLDGLDPEQIHALVARLETGLQQLEPAGDVRVIIASGEPVDLTWKFRARTPVSYPATLWVWLSTDGDRELLLAREVEINAHHWLMVPVIAVRIVAAFLASGALITALFIIGKNRLTVHE